MRLFAKTGTCVQGGFFSEHTLQRVNCGQFLSVENRVQTADYGAIEIPPQLVLVLTVRGQGQVSSFSDFDEALMRNAYPIQTAGRRQINAETQLDDRTNYD